MTNQNKDAIFLDRKNTALLLVDHQVGLLSGVRDMKTAELKANLVALIGAAKVFNIPIIVTNVSPEIWGEFIPEAAAEIPDIKVIKRTLVNAWDDPAVVAAVEATGRKQLLIAGISFEVCAGFPALSSKAAGYDSRVALDACGTFNEAKRLTGLMRLQAAGVQVVDYATAMTEILYDNADPLAGPAYGAMNMDFANIVYQIKAGVK